MTEQAAAPEPKLTPRQELQKHLNDWAHMLPTAFVNRLEDWMEKHFLKAAEPEPVKIPEAPNPVPKVADTPEQIEKEMSVLESRLAALKAKASAT